MPSDLGGIPPSSVSASGTVSGYVLLLARARRGATLQRLEVRALRALYEHRVMCFRYGEKISKHLPFWDLQKKVKLNGIRRD